MLSRVFHVLTRDECRYGFKTVARTIVESRVLFPLKRSHNSDSAEACMFYTRIPCRLVPQVASTMRPYKRVSRRIIYALRHLTLALKNGLSHRLEMPMHRRKDRSKKDGTRNRPQPPCQQSHCRTAQQLSRRRPCPNHFPAVLDISRIAGIQGHSQLLPLRSDLEKSR